MLSESLSSSGTSSSSSSSSSSLASEMDLDQALDINQLEYLVYSVANHQTKNIWLVALTTAVSPRGNRVVRLANKENGSCMTSYLGAVAYTSSTGLATRGNPKITPGEAGMIGNMAATQKHRP